MDVPIEPAWAAIDDFGNISAFHPEVAASHTLTEQATGEGAKRLCRFENGAEIKEKITRYQPGSGYTVTIYDTGTFPIKSGTGRLYLKPTEDGRTEVEFELEFEPKFGPLGKLLGTLAMKPRFEKILASVIRGLEAHVNAQKVLPIPNRTNTPSLATHTG